MDETPASAGGGPALLIITGMSGAGKTRAASVLEDDDWYVVDNLPPQMLAPLARLMTQAIGQVRNLAVVVDIRGREFFTTLAGVLDQFRAVGTDYRVLFLDASDEALVRRFEQVRRPHPLQGEGRMLEGIAQERKLLEYVRSRADVVIDTTDLNVHELAKEIRDAFLSGETAHLQLTVMSFGFKYGVPLDADHMADVRFLANPYWVPELRHLTGQDESVRDYVLATPGATTFATRYISALEPVFDGYRHERKRFATIAIGCTGGKHRSVALSELIAEKLSADGHKARVVHRDLGRE